MEVVGIHFPIYETPPNNKQSTKLDLNLLFWFM